MNDTTLVNNTDRIYGQQDNLTRPKKRQEFVDDEPEWSLGIKITLLLCMTYGLIVALYKISHLIETTSTNLETAFTNGGAIILSIFIVYAVAFGVAWYNGSSRREEMKREAVEEELRRERDMDQDM